MAAETPSRNDGATMRPCPVCSESFEPRGRARYCSDRCRQMGVPPAPPGRGARSATAPKGKRRTATVYACDGCGERALGEQYCAECQTFMRSLGRGGLCPTCDSAVAIKDLLEGGGC